MSKLTSFALNSMIRKYKSGSHISFDNMTAYRVDFSTLDLKSLSFMRCKFDYCTFTNCDMSEADLYGASFYGCDFASTNFELADLRGAQFKNTDLTSCKFTNAQIEGISFLDSNLSKSIGLPTQRDFLSKFKKTRQGYIVYKGFGGTSYKKNPSWIIKPNSIIEEVINSNRSDECGCGVNFGTPKYIMKTYSRARLWECLLRYEDLSDVCVPWGTDGKARCSRLQLIRPITRKEARLVEISS